eukprot:364615-Chlamydomonas_euryale.AAC.3
MGSLQSELGKKGGRCRSTCLHLERWKRFTTALMSPELLRPANRELSDHARCIALLRPLCMFIGKAALPPPAFTAAAPFPAAATGAATSGPTCWSTSGPTCWSMKSAAAARRHAWRLTTSAVACGHSFRTACARCDGTAGAHTSSAYVCTARAASAARRQAAGVDSGRGGALPMLPKPSLRAVSAAADASFRQKLVRTWRGPAPAAAATSAPAQSGSRPPVVPLPNPAANPAAPPSACATQHVRSTVIVPHTSCASSRPTSSTPLLGSTASPLATTTAPGPPPACQPMGRSH